jgi:hypothetical protein
VAVVGCLALAALTVSSGPTYAFGWAAQRLPANQVGSLHGVSCASIRACTAVGDYGVLRWNGSRWMTQSTPTPPPDTFGPFLEGVSCTSSRTCLAVGTVLNELTGKAQSVAERSGGGRWSFQALPVPARRSVYSDGLTGVSCTHNGNCTAVGYSTARSGCCELPLVERWDGRRWAIQSAVRSVGGEFASVSCPSSSTCIAVGSSGNSPGAEVPLVERWDGRRWSIQRFRSVSHLGERTSRRRTPCSIGGRRKAPEALIGSGGEANFADL